MKKIGIWNNYPGFEKNRMFDPGAYKVTPELGYPVIRLREILSEYGYLLETADMDALSAYKKVIFLDFPTESALDIDRIPVANRILICVECELIHPANHIIQKRDRDLFGVIMTYNDDLVSKYGYRKCNLPNKLRAPIKSSWEGKKFLTMMAGNKKVRGKGELYSARRKVISFMEKNHLDKFDLYGPGWDSVTFSSHHLRTILNLMGNPKLRSPFKHASWKGLAKDKIGTLSQYKYCICYENTAEIPGYISEKIFDCFFAGCVPIYWGAPNVEKYIPKNTFIDRRTFRTDEELMSFLSSMSEEEYSNYIKYAEEYLLSENARQFDADAFASLLIDTIHSN